MYLDMKYESFSTDAMEITLTTQRPRHWRGSVENCSLIPTPLAWVPIEQVNTTISKCSGKI